MLSGTRLRMQKLMQATLLDEERHHTWTYRAVRPMVVPASWGPEQRVVGDCSKGCQFVAKWAGGPDPMRNGWADYGNSQTILFANDHVDRPSELEVGDIVTFGRAGRDHAAMVMEAGADPLLWSFGHQGAPNSYRLSVDDRAQQYVKLHITDPPATSADKLRAKTGFFAWVQWKLGEGAWRKYAKADKTVRPKVPRVIPVAWWRDYAQFLLNRKKAL